jgi:hypothetical protein
MYPVPLGINFVVSQQASGTGGFTGADYGRAKLTLTNADPNAVVRVASKLYGTPSNALTIELIDRGLGNTVTATTVQQIGSAIRVTLRRGSSGGILATAAEVAAALNAFTEYPLPIGAAAGGDGTGIVSAVTATALASGVNPTTSPDVFRWGLVNTNFGLFHFEQDASVQVRQIETKFTIASGTPTLTISRVPLNEAFEPITAEAIPLFVYDGLSNAKPDFSISDIELLVPRGWALQVVTSVALAGIVRMDVRRDNR